MSALHDLCAGVLCVGFDGTAIDAPLENLLQRTPFAGLMLFGRNIESLSQTRALTDRIAELLPRSIIAIDQEGGRVMRVRDGVEELPTMLAVAATGDPHLAHRAGAQLAFDLRRVGANVDFAPVLDLALLRMNTVIGSRSFGDDPHAVTLFADAFAQGLRSQGIVPTFKHFPGHGSTEVDSHLALPVVDTDEATLRRRDFVPFAALLPQAEASMTAHVVVRALDPDLVATISPVILGRFLREEIGFAGVCITDCMQMEAIVKGIGSVEGAVRSVMAGADCVLISHSTDLALETIEALVAAVETGRLPRARLEEAHARVQRLRARLHEPLAIDASPPHPGIAREIGRRAVTVVRGDPRADAARSVVVSFQGTTLEGVQGLHTDHASLTRTAAVEELRLPLDPQAPQVDALLADLQSRKKRPIVLMRRAHVYAGQAAAVNRVIDAYADALLVSAREPFDAFEFAAARTVLCIYGDDAPSIAGLGEVLFTQAPAQGFLPLHSLPGERVARA